GAGWNGTRACSRPVAPTPRSPRQARRRCANRCTAARSTAPAATSTGWHRCANGSPWRAWIRSARTERRRPAGVTSVGLDRDRLAVDLAHLVARRQFHLVPVGARLADLRAHPAAGLDDVLAYPLVRIVVAGARGAPCPGRGGLCGLG